MTTRRQFIYTIPAAMALISACSSKSENCEEKQEKSIEKTVDYIKSNMSSFIDPSIDTSSIDVSMVISSLSKIIGNKEIKSDSEAAAIIVESIKNDSEKNDYVTFGRATVTQTEGFIHLVVTQKNLSLRSYQPIISATCKT